MYLKKIITSLMLPVFFICFAFAENSEIDITSDRAEYSKVEQRAVFSGNVKLKADTGGPGMFLSCDEAKIDTAGKDIILKNAVFTTCDLEHPHYRFAAKKSHVVMDEEMSATNAVFYVGKIPLFFLPYYYKSLKHRPYKLEVKPGYSRKEGVFLKGLFGYPLSANVYGKLFLDFFSYKGWGKGTELLYKIPGKAEGTFYGYHIREKDTQRERWNLRLYHWQLLPHDWVAQINSNAMSDESFNNFYSDDWMRVNKDINSSLAFTKSISQATARVLVSRRDVYDVNKDAFAAADIALPAVSYNTSQIKIGALPLYYTWGTNMDRLWNSTTDFYMISGSGNFTVENPLRLTKSMMLTSMFGMSESWLNRKSKTDFGDTFRTVYQTNLNLKMRSWYVFEHNIGHSFQQEINKKNDPYHGVLVNKLNASEWLYLDKISLRVWTGLNIMTMLNEKISSLRERMDSVVSEFDYSPYRQVDFYYRNDYSVAMRRSNSHQISSSAKFFRKEEESGYIKTGFSQEASNPETITFLGDFGIRPDNKWQLAYKIQTSVIAARRSLSAFTVYEQAISVHRDLHCWEAEASYSFRTPDQYEFWFNIRLKPTAGSDDKRYPENTERQWYPWR